jgi:large subunit ribosomal protein L16
MLEPKKIKRRKQHRYRGAFGRKATRGTQLAFGTVGLKTQIWIRIFPHTPVSRKAAEVPMGSGKGSLDRYSTIVRAGTMIFEMGGLDEQAAKTALRLAAYKLPLLTKIVTTSLL